MENKGIGRLWCSLRRRVWCAQGVVLLPCSPSKAFIIIYPRGAGVSSFFTFILSEARPLERRHGDNTRIEGCNFVHIVERILDIYLAACVISVLWQLNCEYLKPIISAAIRVRPVFFGGEGWNGPEGGESSNAVYTTERILELRVVMGKTWPVK